MLRRALGTLPQAPWVFRQGSAPLLLRPLSAVDRSLLSTQLPATFAYSYSSLVEALCSHDYAALADCLEGKLYHKVESLLKNLEFAGFHLHPATKSKPNPPKLYNLSMHLGVNIQRIQNLPSFQVFNLNFLKDSIDPAEFSKQKEAKGISPDFDLLKMDLGNIWAYIGEKAPAKLVVAVDAVYIGENPVSMLQEGKDVVYRGRVEEVHVVRFECTATDVGEQKDYDDNSRLTALLTPLLTKDLDLKTAVWTITDVDNLLQGNPHISSNS